MDGNGFFVGKTVLVTGSGAGMGREAARAFAKRGANVVVNSQSDSASAVQRELETAGTGALFVQGDVSLEADARRLVSQTVDRFGGIDVLVNCAGIVTAGNVEELTVEEWDRGMAVNVRSVYLMCRFALPYLRQVQGCIVNIASAIGFTGVANRALYGASKGAVIALSKSMAREYIGQGIRVNCVCPGAVETPSFVQRFANRPDPQQALQAIRDQQPMGRIGDAREVAEAIVFLASPNAGFMTGTNLVMDGGMTM